jgi:hypothetical protein
VGTVHLGVLGARGQLLGRLHQLELHAVDLVLQLISVAIPVLHHRPLLLFHQLRQLQLEAYRVICQPRIFHKPLIPGRSGKHASRRDFLGRGAQ